MKKRLCIGLIYPSEVLISILESIGVWYEEVDFRKNLDDYALLIVDNGSFLQPEEISIVRNYHKENGIILEISTTPLFYSVNVTRSFRSTLFNSKTDSPFDRIFHLDIFTQCALSNSSNILSGLVDFQKTEEFENIGFIGLDLLNLPEQIDYTRKRFLSTSILQPDELVNKVSRDTLNDIIELSIKELLFANKLPFIKKWISPKKNPVFAFRIDSDYGTKESLQNIYSLLDKHSIKATWFLHVSAHEHWLEFFKDLKNQEIALHGYNHGYSSSISKVKSNIEKGLTALIANNINPKGFCAPYGIWNHSLESVLKDFDFSYSSEFTAGYDSVPFFQQEHKNLQIPIHPICTGSMSRKRYSIEEIQQYFLKVYESKMHLFKPIVFYHHPLQIGLNVFEEIFKKVNTDELTNLTFEEYANFWRKRSSLKFSAYYDNGKLEIKSEDSNLFLYVSNSQDSFELIKSTNIELSKESKGTFKYETPSLPSLKELRKLNNNRIDLIKTSFIDWKNRNRL